MKNFVEKNAEYVLIANKRHFDSTLKPYLGYILRSLFMYSCLLLLKANFKFGNFKHGNFQLVLSNLVISNTAVSNLVLSSMVISNMVISNFVLQTGYFQNLIFNLVIPNLVISNLITLSYVTFPENIYYNFIFNILPFLHFEKLRASFAEKFKDIKALLFLKFIYA